MAPSATDTHGSRLRVRRLHHSGPDPVRVLVAGDRAALRMAGSGVELPDRDDPANHATIRGALTRRFRERTQAEWAEVFDGTDACVAPVVPLSEAPHHPHLAARGTFVERDGVTQPAPAPRFSRTAATLDAPPARPGEHTREALTAWGIADVDALLESGAAVQN